MFPTEVKEQKIKILKDEVKNRLVDNGFKLSAVESACARHVAVSDKAYSKIIGFAFSDRPVTVYVFKEGIGVDIDYQQGRNYINNFWQFSKCENFDEAYRKMVNFTNDYLDHKIHSALKI
jgi:hypothetical protein